MAAPLLATVRALEQQVKDAVALLAGQIAVASVGLPRDLAGLVAGYACEGLFSAAAQHLPCHFLAARDGHWWSMEWPTLGPFARLDDQVSLRVESTRFAGQVSIVTGYNHGAFLAELPHGQLLLLTSSLTHLYCTTVEVDGKAAGGWRQTTLVSPNMVWVTEAALVAPDGSATLELLVPMGDGVVCFDARTGNVLRTHLLFYLCKHRFVQADGCMALVSDKEVLIFGPRLGLIVNGWPNPLQRGCRPRIVHGDPPTLSLDCLSSGTSVRCELLTGRVLDWTRFEPLVKELPSRDSWRGYSSPGSDTNVRGLIRGCKHVLYTIW